MNVRPGFARTLPPVVLLPSVVLLSAAGCGGSDATSPRDEAPRAGAAAIAAVSGDGQVGEVGTALADPLVVRVEDSSGRPLSGVTVSWRVVRGGGSLSASSTSTDAEGRAQVSWSLGSTAGAQEVTAEAGGEPPARFSAEAEPGPPAEVRKVSGDRQDGLAGTVLAEPLVVRAVDEFGNAVPEAEVEWAASAGSLEEAEERTDVEGTARATWALPAEAGSYEVQVRVGAAEGAFRADATDFALTCSPDVVEVPRGGSVTVLCSLDPEGAFEGTASLAALDPELPSGVELEVGSAEFGTTADGRTASLVGVAASEDAMAGVSYGAGAPGDAASTTVTLEATVQEGRRSTTSLDITVVAKRPVVRLVYLVPADREVREDHVRAIDRTGRHFQIWLDQESPDGSTFTLHHETVEVLQTPHEADWYAATSSGREEFLWFWDNVVSDGFALTGGGFDDPDNRWVFYIDADPRCGQIGGAGTSGVAVLPANDLRGLVGEEVKVPCPGDPKDERPVCGWVGGFGHELGHALGLPHPPGCDEGESGCDADALMWNGFRSYPDTYMRSDEFAILEDGGFLGDVTAPSELFSCDSFAEETVALPSAAALRAVVAPAPGARLPRLSCTTRPYRSLAATLAEVPEPR